MLILYYMILAEFVYSKQFRWNFVGFSRCNTIICKEMVLLLSFFLPASDLFYWQLDACLNCILEGYSRSFRCCFLAFRVFSCLLELAAHGTCFSWAADPEACTSCPYRISWGSLWVWLMTVSTRGQWIYEPLIFEFGSRAYLSVWPPAAGTAPPSGLPAVLAALLPGREGLEP